MDWLRESPWLLWIGAALAFGVVEMTTLDLLFLMLALGALVAAVVAGAGGLWFVTKLPVVALMVFALVTVGGVVAVATSLTLTNDNRARSAGANLAAQEIDAIRSQGDVFKVVDETRTTPLNGTTFTVRRTASWVSTTRSWVRRRATTIDRIAVCTARPGSSRCAFASVSIASAMATNTAGFV